MNWREKTHIWLPTALTTKGMAAVVLPLPLPARVDDREPVFLAPLCGTVLDRAPGELSVGLESLAIGGHLERMMRGHRF